MKLVYICPCSKQYGQKAAALKHISTCSTPQAAPPQPPAVSSDKAIEVDDHEPVAVSTTAFPHTITHLDSSDLLDMLGFKFHTIYKVLICMQCKTCFIPSHVISHVKTHYDKALPAQWAQIGKQSELEAKVHLEAMGFGVGDELPEKLPNDTLALEGLEIHHSALQCQASGCSFVAGTVETMSRHYKDHHQGTDIPVKDRCKPCIAQHFSSRSPYFSVILVQWPHHDLFSQFHSYYLQHSESPLPLPSKDHNRDIPALLHFTQFHELLSNWYEKKEDRETVFSLCAAPKNIPEDPLAYLLNLVEKYLFENRKDARCLDQLFLWPFETFPV